MPDIASAAMSYAARGWRVIPLNGKRPWMQRWQEIASNDEEVVARWWEQWPSSNVGVALGRGSGIVDIECDSSEAEQEFLTLFNGDPPVTCCYKSVRGRHRLFQWRDDLPHPEKSNFHIGAIEVRTGNGDRGAQSVFPPSVHPTGAVYEWLVHPDECEPAVFPDEVIALVANVPDGRFREALLPSATARPETYWEGVIAGVEEGRRNQSLVEYVGRLLRDIRDPFDAGAIQRLFDHVTLWNDARNRPPLPESEVRASFASILRREQTRHLETTTAPAVAPHIASRTVLPAAASPVPSAQPETTAAPPVVDVPQAAVEAAVPPDVVSVPIAGGPATLSDGTRAPAGVNGWRLVQVDSQPRQTLLYGPHWEGPVNLTSVQFMAGSAIRTQVYEQTGVLLRKQFIPMWEGTKDNASLAAQLVTLCEHVAPKPEDHRMVVVLEGLYEELSGAGLAADDQIRDDRGPPVKMSDGTIFFRFRRMWTRLNLGADKVLRGELSSALEAIGCRSKAVAVSGRRLRFHVINSGSMARLEAILRGSVEALREAVAVYSSSESSGEAEGRDAAAGASEDEDSLADGPAGDDGGVERSDGAAPS